MLKVGITGGIGSGKSTVCKIFKSLGIPILDADAIAKYLMQHDADLKQNLIQHFGEDIFVDKQLQTKVLSAKVFNQAKQLELLNSLVHPAVAAYTIKWNEAQTTAYTIKEAAILIESGTYKDVDIIIGITAPEDIRIKRVLARSPHLTTIDIQARISKQISDEARSTYCQHIIVNDDEQLLLPQVLIIHEKLLALSSVSQ